MLRPPPLSLAVPESTKVLSLVRPPEAMVVVVPVSVPMVALMSTTGGVVSATVATGKVEVRAALV